jgi:hypothetical protein
MIEPDFLTYLRQHHRAEMVLTMVQLEQLIPGWWESIGELALQMGCDRGTLSHNLSQLEKRGLIRYYSISNKSGTWIWWVKRHSVDAPRPEDEPGWDLTVLPHRGKVRIPISKRREWAKDKGIPLSTLCGFLYGRQKVLRDRWQVLRSPFDVEIIE